MVFKKLIFFAFMLISLEQSAVAETYIGITHSFHEMIIRNGDEQPEITMSPTSIKALIGYKFNIYNLPMPLSVEFGAFQMTAPSELVKGIKPYHLSLDALCFIPITKTTDIFGGFGIAATNVSYKLLSESDQKISMLPRFVIGTEIDVNDSLSLRLSSSIEGSEKTYKSLPYKYSAIISYGAGIIYSF